MVYRFDIGRLERARRRNDIGRDVVAARQRLRRGKACADHGRSVSDQIEAHQAGLLLEDERLADGPAFAFALTRQNESGADIGVAGERHLGPRRKDAHLGGVRGIARRQHESRLRKIKLGGNRLHLRGRDAAAVKDDGKRIAAEGSLGENIDRDELKLHGLANFLHDRIRHCMRARRGQSP